MFKTILACGLVVQTDRARGSRKLGSRVLFVLLSMFAVAPIEAKLLPSGSYVSITGGPVFVNDADLFSRGSVRGKSIAVQNVSKFDTGFNTRGAFGSKINRGPFRIEGEIGYRNAEIKAFPYESFSVDDRPANQTIVDGVNRVLQAPGNTTSLSIMTNAYCDLHDSEKFLQYLGGGIGIAHVSVNAMSYSGTSDNIAYQFIGGVGYKVSGIFTLTTGYRYFATTTIELKEFRAPNFASETGMEIHSVEMGLRFHF